MFCFCTSTLLESPWWRVPDAGGCECGRWLGQPGGCSRDVHRVRLSSPCWRIVSQEPAVICRVEKIVHCRCSPVVCSPDACHTHWRTQTLSSWRQLPRLSWTYPSERVKEWQGHVCRDSSVCCRRCRLISCHICRETFSEASLLTLWKSAAAIRRNSHAGALRWALDQLQEIPILSPETQRSTCYN